MEKVLEKKVVKKSEDKVVPQVNHQLEAIEKLTMLNSSLVEQVRVLSADIDNLKDRVAQVATRLGI